MKKRGTDVDRQTDRQTDKQSETATDGETIKNQTNRQASGDTHTFKKYTQQHKLPDTNTQRGR